MLSLLGQWNRWLQEIACCWVLSAKWYLQYISMAITSENVSQVKMYLKSIFNILIFLYFYNYSLVSFIPYCYDLFLLFNEILTFGQTCLLKYYKMLMMFLIKYNYVCTILGIHNFLIICFSFSNSYGLYNVSNNTHILKKIHRSWKI